MIIKGVKKLKVKLVNEFKVWRFPKKQNSVSHLSKQLGMFTQCFIFWNKLFKSLWINEVFKKIL